MDIRRTSKPLIVGLAVAVTGIVPSGALGGTSAACPQGAGTECEEIGPRPTRSSGTDSQSLIQQTTDKRGQQVWRHGNYVMY
jgi:hypothetical protein